MYVKCTLRGEPARIVPEPKERGLVRSAREAVVRGPLALYGKITEHDPGWLMLLRKMGLHRERAQEGGG